MKYKEVKPSKELETFLRKEGLLRKFKKNVILQRYSDMKDKTVYNIASAILWDLTPEGWEFWNKVNNHFLNFQSKK
jgi:hypothetical protein